MKLYTIIALSILAVPLIPGRVVHYQAPEGMRVEATVTAYTSSKDETDEDPHTTASGTKVGKGTIACPERLKFGSKVQIGDQVYTCLDRMNKRYRSKEVYDIWVESKGEAYKWGKRELTILVNEK
jgi:3D (Asp-Asp-Asp) domain-containing protein